jgi:MFS family permease
VKHLRNGFYPLLIGTTLHFVAWGLLEPLVPLFVLELGGSKGMVGVVTSAGALMPLIAAVWIGTVSARIGARRSLLIGGVGTIFAFLIFAFSRSLPLLILAQAIFGLFHLWRIIPAQAWVSFGTGPDLYRNFGYYTTCVTIGQLIGPPLGGWLLEHSQGWIPTAHSQFAFSFLVGLVFMVISTVTHMLLPEEDLAMPKAASTGGMNQVLKVVRQKDVQLLTLLSLIMWFGISLRRSYFPVYLQEIGLTPSLVGIVLAAYSTVSLIMRPFLGKMVEWLGQRRLLYGSFGIAVLVLLAIPFTTAAIPLLVFSAFWGVTHGAGIPVVMAMSTAVVAPADRTTSVGIRVAANRIGEGVGPLLFGLAAATTGLGSVFLLASGLMGIGFYCSLLVQRRFDPL